MAADRLLRCTPRQLLSRVFRLRRVTTLALSVLVTLSAVTVGLRGDSLTHAVKVLRVLSARTATARSHSLTWGWRGAAGQRIRSTRHRVRPPGRSRQLSGLYEGGGNDCLGVDFFKWHQGVIPPLGVYGTTPFQRSTDFVRLFLSSRVAAHQGITVDGNDRTRLAARYARAGLVKGRAPSQARQEPSSTRCLAREGWSYRD